MFSVFPTASGTMKPSPKRLNNLSFVVHAWFEKPVVMLRSFRFLLLRLLGKQALRGMDIAVTYDCNLSCPHCNVAAQKNSSRREMSDTDIVRAISQLKQAGGFYVTFTGGEILMVRDRLKTIIDRVGKRSMLFQVQTNGTLLSDDVCKELKDMGVDNIQISFDTYHETPDWSRVLDLKTKQLRMVRRHGMDVFFTWLASHTSLAGHEIRDIIRFSKTHKVKIGLNFAVPQGRWSNNRSMLLAPKDSLMLRSISRENPYLYIDLENNLKNYGCPAFSERFHINAYGDVQPCTFFQISFGNLALEPLKAILQRGAHHPLFHGFPDHCPPAENKDYISRWFDEDFKTLPVPHQTFFKDRFPKCVVCGKPVDMAFLSGLREVEYGLPWTGNIMKCSGCGLIQQVPMLTETQALNWYPDEYIHYNPQTRGLKAFLMNIYMGRTLKLLKKLGVKKGDRLLDIGCGAGEKLAILHKRMGLDVQGVEPNPTAAEKARLLFGLSVKTGTFVSSDFAENSFDVVRINHVIEHVPDPVAFLNDIHRILKPGGVMIGETENIDCPSFNVFKRYWALLHLPYHLVLFSESTLRKAFAKSLFNRAVITHTGDPPAWSLSLQNVLRRNTSATARTSSRMRGYILLTLLSAPLSMVEARLFQGPVLEFFSYK